MAGHIATARDANWTTEKRIVDRVKRVFGGRIDLDPCSNERSIVGAERNYSLPERNGLKEPWDAPTTFFNPPYGRSYLHVQCNTVCIARSVKRDKKSKAVTEYICPRCQAVLKREQVEGSNISDWVAKGHLTSEEHYSLGVIGLIPAAVSTRHFRAHVWGGANAICFPYKRLRFEGAPLEDAEKANDAGGSAPMDTALVYWGSDADAFDEAFEDVGHIVRLDLQALAKAERATDVLTVSTLPPYDSIAEMERSPTYGDLQSPAASGLRSEAA